MMRCLAAVLWQQSDTMATLRFLMRRTLRIATASSVLVCCGVSAQDQAPAMPPAQVEVATAQIRNLAPLIEVSGSVVSRNDSRIATEIEGVLTAIVDIGTAVEAGDVIAEIDSRLIGVERKRARAVVARLQADLAFREQQLKRSEELAASSLASATRVDESRAQRDRAKHELAEARAQLERADGDLVRTKIKAPFAGHVMQRLASLGEYVSVGEDIARLVDTQRKEVALRAPIALAPLIAKGDDVLVTSGPQQHTHPVRTVVPIGDEVSRMVEIRLDASDTQWLVGTPVQVSLPSAEASTAIAIPRDALVQRGGQSFIYRISDDGTAEQLVADIRTTVGLWVGVDNDIAAGDQVVVRGGERLAPGQPVAIKASNPAN